MFYGTFYLTSSFNFSKSNMCKVSLLVIFPLEIPYNLQLLRSISGQKL